MALVFFQFLWRHKVASVVVTVLLLVISWLGVRLWTARADSADLTRQLASYDAVVEIHEGAYLQQTAQLELAETLIREYSPQPGSEVAYQAVVKVITKTRTIRVPVVETRIEYRDSNIEINGDLTADKPGDAPTAIEMHYTLAPIKIDLFVTRIKGKYQTIVDTHVPDVAVEMTTRLDPAVFQDDRPWFAGAGPLVRLRDFKVDSFGIADIGVQASIGYMFPRWFVSASVQYLDGFGVGMTFGGRW
jgi:hypothetical protein